GKGALSERHDGVRRFLAADPPRFEKAAQELLALLEDIAGSHDLARLRDLLEAHGARLDTQWRDEVIERLRAAGVPRRVAILPPGARKARSLPSGGWQRAPEFNSRLLDV